MSTSAEYKPRDNLVPRLIEGNQFRMELAEVVTSFVQTLLIWMHLVWIQCTCTSTVVVWVLFQWHHFCLAELEDETFRRQRPKEFEVRRMRTVSASMEYKPSASLVPMLPW